MEKYQQYVNSGFEWIGDIPVQWNNLRLRFVCEFRNGYTPSKANPEFWEDGTIPWYRMEDIRDSGRKLEEAKQYVTKDAIKGGGLFEAGSFILATTATIGEHAVLIVDSLANQQFTNLKIRKSLSNRLLRDYFFYYLFVIDDYCKATTKTSTFPAVSMELLKNCHVVFPLVQEQQAIVDYLDKKCSEIDNVISAQQKRIALLQELKQSVITHAVTKGLDPNVEMKDSGVEWIGKVPTHWELIRTRYLCNLCTGNKDTINRVDDGKYPFYVRSPKVERINTYSFDGEAILMAGDGVGAGKVFHYAKGKFDYHQRVYNFHNFKRVIGKFFFHYIANNFRYIIEEGGAKNTVDSVRLYMIQNFLMTVPTIEEQYKICEYIEQKEMAFDTAISKAQHQVELLQEYKQSLITEVVTGKRKVS